MTGPYTIGEIPIHNTTPAGGEKVELEATDGSQSEWATLSEIFAALGGSGGMSWSKISTNTDAAAAHGYFVDTSSGAVTLTLPASPTIGDEVSVVDYAASFNINNLTVARNGNNIGATAEDMTVSTKQISFTLIYCDATLGWAIS